MREREVTMMVSFRSKVPARELARAETLRLYGRTPTGTIETVDLLERPRIDVKGAKKPA